MPALAKNYTITAADLRGLGDSSKSLTGYDGKTVAEDIHQLVTQLGFKTIMLQGHLNIILFGINAEIRILAKTKTLTSIYIKEVPIAAR